MENYSANNCDIENADSALSRVTIIDETAIIKENKINRHLLPYLSYDIKKGDVLQIISCDKTYMQVFHLLTSFIVIQSRLSNI